MLGDCALKRDDGRILSDRKLSVHLTRSTTAPRVMG
jgi:hypothetical protein